MKKFVSLLVLLCFICSLLFVSVSASSISMNETREMLSYIEDVLPIYMLAPEGSAANTFWITQGYSFQNTDRTAEIFFIFDSNGYVGRMIVDRVDNRFTSTLNFEYIQAIEELVYNSVPFMLVKPDEYTLLLCWENGTEVLQNITGIEIVSNNSDTAILSSFDYMSPILTEVQLSESVSPQVDATDYYVALDVKHVKNGLSDEGIGICWAASIAAISNFRQGTNWTAYSLYSAIKKSNMAEPSGTMAWYRTTFNYLGLTPTSSSSVPSWKTVYNALSATRPLLFHVQRNSNGSASAHAIVCKYFSGGNNQVLLGFMDPNESSTQYTTIYSENLDFSELIYTNSAQTYTEIYGYVY